MGVLVPILAYLKKVSALFFNIQLILFKFSFLILYRRCHLSAPLIHSWSKARQQLYCIVRIEHNVILFYAINMLTMKKCRKKFDEGVEGYLSLVICMPIVVMVSFCCFFTWMMWVPSEKICQRPLPFAHFCLWWLCCSD